MDAELPDPEQIKVYRPRTGKQFRIGAVLIGIGLFCLWPLIGGHAPQSGYFGIVAGLICGAMGCLMLVNALRGLPRLTVTKTGVVLDNGLGSKWANWSSLGDFEVAMFRSGRLNRKIHLASARIVGGEASPRVLKRRSFVLPDHFQIPVQSLAEELNATRAALVGAGEAMAVPPQEIEPTIGVAGFGRPWLTYAYLAVLVIVFVIENLFGVGSGGAASPAVGTLLAMGGLQKTAFLTNGEWYRLFTAPFLHASFTHLLMNCAALLLGGPHLERLIGRLWFCALIIIAGLSGALMSLAANESNIISVGASGALMGMFAALFACSFRLPKGSTGRQRLQVDSARVLIPSMLPMLSTVSGMHVDYGAHVGGAIGGAVMGAIMLAAWSGTERVPRLRPVAAGLSAIGALLLLVSTGIAAETYPKYNVSLIPQAQLPTDASGRRTRAAELIRQYPGDPRAHLFLAEALMVSGDKAGAEPEARKALDLAHAEVSLLGIQMEYAARGSLAALLSDEGKRDEAKEIARPFCEAPQEKRLEAMRKLLTAQKICD